MKHEIITTEPRVTYSLTLRAKLEDAPDVPVNTWTNKIMQPQLVVVTYQGPGSDGRPIGATTVSVSGKRRRASDGALTADENLWQFNNHDFLAPVLENLRAVALDTIAMQVKSL